MDYAKKLSKRSNWENSLNKRTKSFLLRKSDKCALCGIKFESMKDVTIDHIIPLSKGGVNGISNMQLAHESCNFKKGNKMPNALEVE